MLAIMKLVAGALIAPLTRLGEQWLRHRNDRYRLEHETRRVEIASATTFGLTLLATWAGRIPVFVLLLTVDLHVAAVFIDSTWPQIWLTPLALPAIYQTIMEAVVIGQIGVAAWRTARRH